ncbi:class I SAM-dependent methyltransferase [Methylobacter sp. YRD-M1]|uniref:class I SAM-dependent methyltransferase n=1 Tax=Methylobacter sp. YRD-M1 TaxID=2911520 RepID=UPI00227B2EF3|nr:class I SAM-dependent methyltransferase [Methylobacter sp. YRD-M1]WAK03806.1 class I SAM-dependent methyltransferase [Methylobacter sp. YRD-M1]
MNVTSSKSFWPIHDDYLFFQEQSTEADEDLRSYIPYVHALAAGSGPIHMLDFGSGSGRFACQLLALARLPSDRLQLSLVEPDEEYRQQAIEQLQPFAVHPVQTWPALPPGLEARFDLVLANHVFYYVPDLDEVLGSLLPALTLSGLFLAAMAENRNTLIQFETYCFALINMPYPYHTAEDLEASLDKRGEVYRKQAIHYELAFPDAEENRLKIMRFLMGDYFDEIPRQPMADLFSPYAQAGRIVIKTGHEQFIIQRQAMKARKKTYSLSLISLLFSGGSNETINLSNISYSYRNDFRHLRIFFSGVFRNE